MSKHIVTYDPGRSIEGDGWLRLHRNENLLITEAWTVEAARELAPAAAIASYPDVTGEPLRRALADLYGVKLENVFLGNGSDEVLADLFSLLRERYDAVGLPDICFKVYHLLASRYGFKMQVLPGDTFNTGRLDLSEWSGLAVVDSPNSVTGQRYDSAELIAAAERGAFVIWDNAYGEYARDMIPTNIPANMAIVRTFSKLYGLAGLRIGYCIADEALIAELLRRKDVFNVNGFAQVMAVEALRRPAYFDDLLEQALAGRQEMVDGLRRLGFSVREPAGNFILLTHPVYSADLIEAELLKRKIVVRRYKDPPVFNYFRVAIPPRADIERLLAALAEILDQVKG